MVTYWRWISEQDECFVLSLFQESVSLMDRISVSIQWRCRNVFLAHLLHLSTIYELSSAFTNHVRRLRVSTYIRISSVFCVRLDMVALRRHVYSVLCDIPGLPFMIQQISECLAHPFCDKIYKWQVGLVFCFEASCVFDLNLFVAFFYLAVPFFQADHSLNWHSSWRARCSLLYLFAMNGILCYLASIMTGFDYDQSEYLLYCDFHLP